MQPDLQHKGILITGASGGIGSELAIALSRSGAHCFLHCHRNQAAAEALASQVQADHPFSRLAVQAADLRDESQVESLFASFESWCHTPHGLVVNAGIWPARATPLRDMSLGQWRKTLDVNLTGAFLTCRGFLQLLSRRQARSASIVLIGSTAGLYGEEGHADYAASKAALTGLMLSLKNEIVRQVPMGRVNLIHPGWVATPMAAASLADAELVDRVTSTMALRKVAQPHDVATLATFLLADNLSGHLTGVALPVAGGMEGRLLHTPSVGSDV